MLLYAYQNESRQVQIVQIPQRGFERTVLPGNKMLFEAEPGDFLEVICPQHITTMLCQRIRCDRLVYEVAYEDD
jgi:hypothetical protein